MKGLLVVVNYNQGEEIGKFLPSLERWWPKADSVVVDDGSSDRSPTIAEEAGYRVLRGDRNRGVGDAIRRGIYHARDRGDVDYVVIMSSNGKMRPEELEVVTAPVREGRADYVQGNRFLRADTSIKLTTFRSAAIPAFSLFSSAMLGRRFTDISCGFRAYTLRLALDPRLDISQEWLSRYEMEYYLHYWACRLDYRIVEVPVTIDYSHLGRGRRSKIKPIVGWWSMTRPFVLLKTGLRR